MDRPSQAVGEPELAQRGEVEGARLLHAKIGQPRSFPGGEIDAIGFRRTVRGFPVGEEDGGRGLCGNTRREPYALGGVEDPFRLSTARGRRPNAHVTGVGDGEVDRPAVG